jgi:hypothetical protein
LSESSKFRVFAAAGSILLFLSGLASAEEPIVFELPLQGIQIETAAGGEWERIYSTGIQPVEFPDRRGISTAQKIAEQRAKAEIVKFFDQQMSAETIVSEMESSSQVATRQQGSAGDGFGKDSQRVLATSLSEVLRSYSSSNLRGVIVLKTGYDETSEEAWVKVGISRASIAMAGDAKAFSSGSSGASETGKKDERDSESVSQPSEVRKGKELP